MAFTIRTIFQFYQKLMDEMSDPRVEDWFLMQSVCPVVLILAGYLYFVLKCGPRFMLNRQPFNLDKILITYNVVQIVYSSYLLMMFFLKININYNFWCQPLDYTPELGLEVAVHVWLYFLLKVIDLLDTVFFVFRKKENQISFLHVYHHAGMVLATWVAVKFVPGGTVIYVGVFNSIVHIIMYTYYLITVRDKKLKENIWWKQRLTQLQIIQFGIIFFQHTAVLLQPKCQYPKFVSLFLVTQNLFMVSLFSDFYYRAYIQKKQCNIKQSPAQSTDKKN